MQWLELLTKIVPYMLLTKRKVTQDFKSFFYKYIFIQKYIHE
jgi:hypothetical protein